MTQAAKGTERLVRTGGGDQHNRSTLGTLRNAGVLLELLGDGPIQMPFSELWERSGLPASTTHRLLRSLVLAGLVQQDPRTSRYSLGPAVVRLSESYLARQPALRALAPYLVELRTLTHATVLVAILVGSSVLYADRVDADHAGGIFREANRVHDALETAAGRVLLAHADEAVWDEALKVSAVGHRFGPDERAEWAAAPFLAVERAEARVLLELAVPVFDRSGRAVAALSALESVEPATEAILGERVAPLLRAARAAGQAVGDV